MSAAKLYVLVFFVAALAGCGGGGSSDSAPKQDAPVGLYNGVTDRGSVTSGVVLGDGEYYFIYGEVVDGTLFLDGVIQGTGTARNNRFRSSNLKDFNFSSGSILNGTLDTDFIYEQFVNGAVNYSSGDSSSFSLAYDSNFEKAADPLADAGFYTGYAINTRGEGEASLTMNKDGSFAGMDVHGCSYKGTFSPRSEGDVYSMAITFTDTACTYNGQTINGIAYVENGELWAAAPDSNRSGGVFFVGEKQ